MLTLARTALGALLGFCVIAHAGTVNIGVISFNLLIPGSTGSPGVNVFSISNFTGGFALPPDFSVLTPVTFTLGSLELTGSNGPETILLGNIDPGTSIPPASVQFADTVLFSSAIFSATLSETTFLLSDGSSFVAASQTIQTILLPSSGGSLVADTDLAVITVDDVPEPVTFTLMFTGLTALSIGKRKFSPRI